MATMSDIWGFNSHPNEKSTKETDLADDEIVYGYGPEKRLEVGAK
jgi:hypothetical protein